MSQLIYWTSLLMLMSFSHPNEEGLDNLEGKWIRVSGSFVGDVVEIRETAPLIYEGYIVKNSAISFFYPGDLKWQNFQKDSPHCWRIEDLTKYYNGKTSGYAVGMACLTSKNILEVTYPDDLFRPQRWQRLSY